jgi:hypothetical protein
MSWPESIGFLRFPAACGASSAKISTCCCYENQLTSKPPPIMQRLRSIFNRPAKGLWPPYGGRTLEYKWQALGKLNWIGGDGILRANENHNARRIHNWFFLLCEYHLVPAHPLETVIDLKKAQKSPDRVKECIGH